MFDQMSHPPVHIDVKDRMRLVMAVLAISDWPAQEQAQQTHAVHPHAKETARFLQPFTAHPAVLYANKALAHHVPLEDMFKATLRSSWPDLRPFERPPGPLLDGRWLRLLAEFRRDTAVDERFWPTHRSLWDKAADALSTIFAGTPLPGWLASLTGRPLAQTIVIMPNLVYPARQTLLADTLQNLYVIVPPPPAVGESPPWPYQEDPAAVHVAVCQALTDHLLADILAELDESQAAILPHALSTLYLETAVDEAEAMAYLVRAKKQHNLPDLPTVVDNLRQQIADGTVDLSGALV